MYQAQPQAKLTAMPLSNPTTTDYILQGIIFQLKPQVSIQVLCPAFVFIIASLGLVKDEL